MYHDAVQQGSRRRAMRMACAAAVASLTLHLPEKPAFAGGAANAKGVEAPTRSSVDVAPSPAPPSAQQLADQAFELHAAGNYAAAIAMYLKAYEASSSAVTLLNIATIYDRKLHERDLAADYYRRYLHAPDAEPDLVQKATERLTALKQGDDVRPASRATGADASPATDTALPGPGELRPAAPDGGAIRDADRPSRESAVRTTGFVIGATGLGALGSSLVLGLLAKGKNDDANALCEGAECSSSEGVNLAHQAGGLATASTLMFIAGLGLAGGGLAMVLLAPRASDPGSARVALAASSDGRGAGLDLHGDF
jgi:tetratricopeptide (TPR) repeat protein